MPSSTYAFALAKKRVKSLLLLETERILKNNWDNFKMGESCCELH